MSGARTARGETLAAEYEVEDVLEAEVGGEVEEVDRRVNLSRLHRQANTIQRTSNPHHSLEETASLIIA